MALEYPRDMLRRLLREKNTFVGAVEEATAFALVDGLFFASQILEESEPTRVALVYHPEGAAGLRNVVDSSPVEHEDPELAWDVTAMQDIDFEPRALAKLARGLEYGRQVVVIGGNGTKLRIGGTARRIPRTDGGDVFRIAAPRPGTLVFEHHYRATLRYEAGQQVSPGVDVLGRNGPVRTALGRITKDDGTSFSGSEAGYSGIGIYSFTESALRRLLRQMRATEAGAILAILPRRPAASLLRHVPYVRTEPLLLASRISAQKKALFARVNVQFKQVDRKTHSTADVREAESVRLKKKAADDALEAAIDDIARLSAIDGAVLAGPKLSIFGAGYLIKSKPLKAEAIRARDAAMEKTEGYALGHGARHRAAFSFAESHPGAVVFVLSEDGPVSCATLVKDRVVVWPVYIAET